MRKKYIFGWLTFLSLSGFAGGVSYNSFKFSTTQDLKIKIKNLEPWMKDLEEKIKNSFKKIRDKLKFYEYKKYGEQLRDFISNSWNLEYFKNEKVYQVNDKTTDPELQKQIKNWDQNLEREIQNLESKALEIRKKIQNLDTKKLEEIYQAIKEITFFIFEAEKGKNMVNDWKDELIEKTNLENENLEILEDLSKKWSNINLKILREKFEKNSKDLQKKEEKNEDLEKISKELEEILKNEEFKNLQEEIKVWWDLEIKDKQFSNFGNMSAIFEE